MSDVEFGAEDIEYGVDVETGAEDYAAGADAVDAALGAVRRRAIAPRGYVNAGARKAHGMFTYFVGVPTNAATYAGAAAGTATTQCNTPYQVIDLIAQCAANTFGITSFFVGDTNMLLGAQRIPADIFFAAVQNRFVRFTTLQRGQNCQIGFTNVTAVTTPVAITLTLKVRSYRRS